VKVLVRPVLLVVEDDFLILLRATITNKDNALLPGHM
jgi:hypothetical protein